MQDNKNLLLGAIVVLVILAGVMFWFMNKGVSPNSNQNTNDLTESTEDTSGGSINAGSSSLLSYANALAKYQNALLVFDAECKASPNKLTLGNGTMLVVENRSTLDRVVSVGSPFNLKANGFKIIKIESAGASVPVDCDSSQNVATILVQ